MTLSSSVAYVPFPPGGLHRAGRWNDVDSFPAPAAPLDLGAPRLDGYRWEDPFGQFSTVKCSLSAEAAIGRPLARYQRRVVEDPATGDKTGIIDMINAFLSGPTDPNEPELSDGRVPDDVFDDLYLITIPRRADLRFVDLEAPETLTALRTMMAPVFASMQLDAYDENLAREPDRRVTRLILWALRQACAPLGNVSGVRIPGQPHDLWSAYVIWDEPDTVDLTADDVGFRWVSSWDEDTVAAAACLGLTLPPGQGP